MDAKMNINNENLALSIVILIIIVLLIGIIYSIVSAKRRRWRPMNSVTLFGATSEFQNIDQKAAVEHTLEVQADKKMEEEETGEPEKN